MSFCLAFLLMAAGTPAAAQRVESTLQQAPEVAFGGGVHLVVWADYRSGQPCEIYAARVTPTAQVLDPDGFLAGRGPNAHGPAVAFGDGVFLLVWHSYVAPKGVRAARITPGGDVLDTVPIVVSTRTKSYSSGPAVTFNGTDFVVAWHDDRAESTLFRVYAARVTPGGVVRDPDGLAVSPRRCDWARKAIASGGGVSLVAWLDLVSGRWELWGARIAPDGTVLDSAGIPIAPDSSGAWSPSIAFDGTNFLVTMSSTVSDDIHAAFVTPGGAVLDTPFVLLRIDDTQYTQDVAFDGVNYLVVWEDTDPYPFAIRGTRVTPAGAVLDSQLVLVDSGPGFSRSPRIAFDGTNYLVAWEDDRTRPNDYDIYAARVTPAGVVLDPGGFPVCALVGLSGRPAIGPAVESEPSVVRAMLERPANAAPAVLFSAAGRRVAYLGAGRNDLSRIAPGVYFLQTGAAPARRLVLVR